MWGAALPHAAINAAAARAESVGQPVLNLGHGAFSATVVVASLGVAALTTERPGWPWPLLAAAVVILAASVATALIPAAAMEGRQAQPPRPRWSGPLIVLGLLAAVAYLIENAWQSLGAIHLHSTLGASLRVAALAPAVFAGFAAAGRFAGHVLNRRLRPAGLLGAGASVAAAGSVLAALASTSALAMICGVGSPARPRGRTPIGDRSVGRVRCRPGGAATV